MSMQVIENAIDLLSMVPNDRRGLSTARDNMAASLAWSAVAWWLNASHQIDDASERMGEFPPMDQMSGSTLARYEGVKARMDRLEADQAEYENIFAWARLNANPEFVPDIPAVIKLFSEVRPPEMDEAKLNATLLGTSITEERERMLAQSIEQARAFKENAPEAEAKLKLLFAAKPEEGFEISDRTTARVLSKVAAKCEQYTLAKQALVRASKRPSLKAAIAGSIPILVQVMEAADTEAEKLWQEIQSRPDDRPQTPSERTEGRAHEAAVSAQAAVTPTSA